MDRLIVDEAVKGQRHLEEFGRLFAQGRDEEAKKEIEEWIKIGKKIAGKQEVRTAVDKLSKGIF
jgi:hypothetical protein